MRAQQTQLETIEHTGWSSDFVAQWRQMSKQVGGMKELLETQKKIMELLSEILAVRGGSQLV